MYEKSLLTPKREEKTCAAINLVYIPTLSKKTYIKGDLLCLKAHMTLKAILVMDLILNFLSRIVHLDFVEALKPTSNMPESLDLWISAILNCSCFGF